MLMPLPAARIPGLNPPQHPKSARPWKFPHRFSSLPPCRCTLQQQRPEEDHSSTKPNPYHVALKLVNVAAAVSAATVAMVAVGGSKPIERALMAGRRKRTRKFSMSLEERESWTKNLPLVQDWIAHEDLISLKKEGKLKHLIKHPDSKLKSRPYQVLVVFSDDRVVGTVLPALEKDGGFWKSWDDLDLNKFVIDAYTPPAPQPELPAWATKGPSLSFLRGLDRMLMGTAKKGETVSQKRLGGIQSAATMRLQEIERARLEKENARMMKQRRERFEQERKVAELKRAEQEKRELEEKKARKEKLIQQVESQQRWNMFWYETSQNEGVRFFLGVFFFWLFYVVVVVGVKKRKQDYEDRMKILQVEAEEKKRKAEAVRKEAEGLMKVEEEEGDQLKMGMDFMKSGAKVRLRKEGSQSDVKFDDVAGLGDIRRELEEIVFFFTQAERYRRRGSKIPTGILLSGDPGVGKTLLAKAVAGEAGVNFFAMSASQFVEIYVGVGAARVRSLYAEAKENAPAVVFIDELDAVGRQRGRTEGSGGQERDATLNQLLTCLDGFEGKGDVITIAATNRPDILDSALVRPGRFDRKIRIPRPSLRGRMEILKVHARNKPMAEDVDYEAVAHATANMVGAQLAHVVEVAALSALREGRSEVTTDDLIEAAQFEAGGKPDLKPRSERITGMLALLEASMAAMAANYPETKNIQKITIIPRKGEEKGYTRYKSDFEKFGPLQYFSRQDVLDHITILLAPRAAEELWHGPDQLSTIWAENVDFARKTARNFVIHVLSEKEELYGLHTCTYLTKRAWEVDNEAKKILTNCYQRALEYLKRNKAFVDVLVERLVHQKTITREEFHEIVKAYAVLDKPSLSPLEARDLEKKDFQEKMMGMKRVHAG